MPRAPDFGDPAPGDAGDAAPANPIDGLAEQQFSARGPNFETPLKNQKTFFDPRSTVRPQTGSIRDSWMGVVLNFEESDDNFDYYKVVTQDGAIIIASIFHQPGSVIFEPETQVQVVRERGSGNFAIVGQGERLITSQWAELQYYLEPGGRAIAYLWYYDFESEEWKTEEQDIWVHSGLGNSEGAPTEFMQVFMVDDGATHVSNSAGGKQPRYEPVGNYAAEKRIGVTVNEIGAAAWAVDEIELGSGLVQLYRVKVDPNTGLPDDPPKLEKMVTNDDPPEDFEVKWYNAVNVAIPEETIVFASWWQGFWVVDVESCGDKIDF